MLFFACIRRPVGFARGFTAGAIAASLVLIRINTLFFFLPFLFPARRYTRTWLVSFCLPPLLLACWILANPHERALWHDYGALLQEAVKVHQGEGATKIHNAPDPHFAVWEGVDMPAADSLSATSTKKLYVEPGNVFVLVRLVLHRHLPAAVWEPIATLVILALCIVFYLLHKPFETPSLSQLAIFGFCLYMISDLFSPIYRIQYYAVQWFFPLLLAAATWESKQRKALTLLAALLLLSAIHFPVPRLQNTLAEYLLMAILLGASLFTRTKQPPKTGPASTPVSA
jgi:hypothetical protein